MRDHGLMQKRTEFKKGRSDMKEYKYEIFQTNAEQEFSFMEWRIATRHGWSFDFYRSVWNGKEEARDDMDLVNYLYEVFNERRPYGFKRHSLSVGDVIMVHGIDDIDPTYYYCDSFGWQDITADIMAWSRYRDGKEMVG